MFGAAAAWGERPQLARTRALRGRSRPLVAVSTLRGAVPWAVVPLTWLWACVHGSWLLGVAAGGVLLAGAVADRRLSRRRTVQGRVGARRVGAGRRTDAARHAGPHRAVHRDRHGVGVRERVGSSGSGQPGLRGRPPRGGGVRGLGLLRSPTHRWTRLFCLLGGLALALWMVRTIAFGAVLIAPALALALATLRRRDQAGRPGSPERGSCGRLRRGRRVAVGGWHVAPNALRPSGLTGSLGRPCRHVPCGTPRRRRPRRGLGAVGPPGPSAPARPAGRGLLRAGRRPPTRTSPDARPGWQAYAASQGITAILADRDSPLDRALAQAGCVGRLVAEDRRLPPVGATSARAPRRSA